MWIVAFDPGGTTGWKGFDTSERKFHGGFLGPDPHHVELDGFLNSVAPGKVVLESFQYTAGRNLELISVEYIGIIKLWCAKNAVPLKKFTSSQGKGFWDDDKLRRVDLYVVNKHIRDATRHLLQFLSFEVNDQTWIHKLRK